MCVYDATHHACTAELLHLVQRCPFYPECLPHVRQILYRTSVCHLCAVAGLEPGAVMMDGRGGVVGHGEVTGGQVASIGGAGSSRRAETQNPEEHGAPSPQTEL